jgi:hypothetical protein
MQSVLLEGRTSHCRSRVLKKDCVQHQKPVADISDIRSFIPGFVTVDEAPLDLIPATTDFSRDEKRYVDENRGTADMVGDLVQKQRNIGGLRTAT